MLLSRLSFTSNAYKRPVLRINAPSANVLPPAPAHKSATIWPRFGATKKVSNWLPSSCTSILPSVNNTCLLIPIRFGIRIPIGDSGIAEIVFSLLIFSASIFASTSSGLPLIVFTRKSKVACSNIPRQMVKAFSSPYCLASFSHNQSLTSAFAAIGISSVDLVLMAIAHSFCCSFSTASKSLKLRPCTRNSQARINLRASSGSFSSFAVMVLKKRKRRMTP